MITQGSIQSRPDGRRLAACYFGDRTDTEDARHGIPHQGHRALSETRASTIYATVYGRRHRIYISRDRLDQLKVEFCSHPLCAPSTRNFPICGRRPVAGQRVRTRGGQNAITKDFAQERPPGDHLHIFPARSMLRMLNACRHLGVFHRRPSNLYCRTGLRCLLSSGGTLPEKVTGRVAQHKRTDARKPSTDQGLGEQSRIV